MKMTTKKTLVLESFITVGSFDYDHINKHKIYHNSGLTISGGGGFG